MQVELMPKNRLGKWSVGLQAFAVIATVIFVVVVKVLGILSFDDHWWDVSVPFIILANIIAFITEIRAVRRDKEVLP